MNDLAKPIASVTGIDTEILLNSDVQLKQISVARRMSWAALRETTRLEDLAYCLLGIFDVNMPLLYGEGEKAFIRLQEEIMRSSADQSLFVWTGSHSPQRPRIWQDPWAKPCGILARSPRDFALALNAIPIQSGGETVPYAMTNRGLQIQLPLLIYEDSANGFLGLLDCQFEDDITTCIAIPLRATKTSQVFVRVEDDGVSFQKITPEQAAEAVISTIYILRDSTAVSPSYINCSIRSDSLRDNGYDHMDITLVDPQDKPRWNPDTQILRIERSSSGSSSQFGPLATFIFHNRDIDVALVVRLSIKRDLSPRLQVSMPYLRSDLQESISNWYYRIRLDAIDNPWDDSSVYLDTLHDGSLLYLRMAASANRKTIFNQDLYSIDINLESRRRFEMAGESLDAKSIGRSELSVKSIPSYFLDAIKVRMLKIENLDGMHPEDY
jgi:hypothetical protein